MKILCFGEILWDVYPDRKYIGGAPFNFAAHMARHGENAFMLSSLGNDDLGKEAADALQKLGVSHKYVAILEDKVTGRCLVTLDENSVPTYNLLSDVAYDHIPTDNVDGEFDALYFGTLALRSQYNCNSLQGLIKDSSYREIFCDINIRPPFYTKESVNMCVSHATILKISLEEYEVVANMLGIEHVEDYRDFARALALRFENLRCIIITLGSMGAYALDCKGNNEYSCCCRKVKVASTVGAGDSFSAAFLHKYMCRYDIQACIEYATKIAEFVVSNIDAIPNYKAEDFA